MNEELGPCERGGHSCVMFKERFLFVFGGMQEVTMELNDLSLFDIKTSKWHLLLEDNKNASAT